MFMNCNELISLQNYYCTVLLTIAHHKPVCVHQLSLVANSQMKNTDKVGRVYGITWFIH